MSASCSLAGMDQGREGAREPAVTWQGWIHENQGASCNLEEWIHESKGTSCNLAAMDPREPGSQL